MADKKFKSATGKVVRVALTTGHVANIPADGWIDLHPRFHSEAYAKGCVSDDMKHVFEDAPKAKVAKSPKGKTSVEADVAVGAVASVAAEDEGK